MLRATRGYACARESEERPRRRRYACPSVYARFDSPRKRETRILTSHRGYVDATVSCNERRFRFFRRKPRRKSTHVNAPVAIALYGKRTHTSEGGSAYARLAGGAYTSRGSPRRTRINMPLSRDLMMLAGTRRARDSVTNVGWRGGARRAAPSTRLAPRTSPSSLARRYGNIGGSSARAMKISLFSNSRIHRKRNIVRKRVAALTQKLNKTNSLTDSFRWRCAIFFVP